MIANIVHYKFIFPYLFYILYKYLTKHQTKLETSPLFPTHILIVQLPNPKPIAAKRLAI